MRVILLAAAFALAAGCASTEDGGAGPTPSSATPDPRTPEPAGSLRLHTLEDGDSSATHERARLVFTDAAAFGDFWRAAHSEPEPVPEVDFARATVIAAVSHGTDPCHDIEITNATEAEGALQVEVTSFVPQPGYTCIQPLVFPYHVVSIDVVGREVTFVEREVLRPVP